MPYQPNPARYNAMTYVRCGASGLQLPRICLGLWHNFGSSDSFQTMREMCFTAFDAGVTHFDLANNYGPIPGSAEENFGKILKTDLAAYRDELIVSTKAGYLMWPGPYGDWGSRKYMLASLDQSLKRLGLPYVDIFYHHRPDPHTPLCETMGALAAAVHSGKALYAGLSNYPAALLKEAVAILDDLNCPCILDQVRYSILDRHVEEDGLNAAAAASGVGLICFSPLAQGLLSEKYLSGIPAGSRASKGPSFLRDSLITEERLSKVRTLDSVAKNRGQSLPQMALSWLIQQPGVTGVLIGASSPSQVAENVQAAFAPPLTKEELAQIDRIAPVRS
jgi:L-glyceraldehyde 3-phosphate reductase